MLQCMNGQLRSKKRDDSVHFYTSQHHQISEDMTKEIAEAGCETILALGKQLSHQSTRAGNSEATQTCLWGACKHRTSQAAAPPRGGRAAMRFSDAAVAPKTAKPREPQKGKHCKTSTSKLSCRLAQWQAKVESRKAPCWRTTLMHS